MALLVHNNYKSNHEACKNDCGRVDAYSAETAAGALKLQGPLELQKIEPLWTPSFSEIALDVGRRCQYKFALSAGP